jgi:hypothetical protein
VLEIRRIFAIEIRFKEKRHMSRTERMMILEKKGMGLVFQFGPVPTEPSRIFGGNSGRAEKFIHGQAPYGGFFAALLQSDYSVCIR